MVIGGRNDNYAGDGTDGSVHGHPADVRQEIQVQFCGQHAAPWQGFVFRASAVED